MSRATRTEKWPASLEIMDCFTVKKKRVCFTAICVGNNHHHLRQNITMLVMISALDAFTAYVYVKHTVQSKSYILTPASCYG